jgi:hypothetical protein
MRNNQAKATVPKGSSAGSAAPRPPAAGASRNGKAATTRPSPSLKPGLY